MDLDGRQIQFLHDVGVLDHTRFLKCFPFQPFRREARTGDGGAAPEGFELRIYDRAVRHLDLQLHDFAALRRSHDTRADSSLVLLKTSHVAWVAEMVHHFVADLRGELATTVSGCLVFRSSDLWLFLPYVDAIATVNLRLLQHRGLR